MGEHSLESGVSLRRAVFLDRDGVINFPVVRDGKPYPPDCLADFRLMPGVPEGCRLLKEAGFLLVVATNQPDVGRGTMKQADVEEIHAEVKRLLPVDRIEVCYDAGGTQDSIFRKPKPGMLLQAARDLGLDLPGSFMIGDRWRDVDCGHAAGCRTVFIDYGYAEQLRQKPDFCATDFLEAVGHVLANSPSTLTD